MEDVTTASTTSARRSRSSKVVAYAQGLDMIREASRTYDWGIDVAEVAKIWRGGCIIRARLLERIDRPTAARR